LAGQWLARLHNRPAGKIDVDALRKKEEHRFASYERTFMGMGKSFFEAIKPIVETVRSFELSRIQVAHHDFVQCHGDYHPKNIIIGQDHMHDPDTQFISVIDFNNKIQFLPAFDVGYFLAQFQSQFSERPEIVSHYNDELFVSAYRQSISKKDPDFDTQLSFFKLRANLSIAAYLIKVGKGESREMEDIIARSSKLITEIG
jgi:Ser/Thr protein kinase RdoA (MazF antagonist)